METIYYYSRNYEEEHQIETSRLGREYRIGQFTGNYNIADMCLDTNIIVCDDFMAIFEILGEIELDYLDTKIQLLQVI